MNMTMTFGTGNRMLMDERTLKIVVFVAISLAGLTAGVTASAGSLQSSALLVAALSGLIIVMLPRVLFWTTLVTGILVAGAMRLYYPELQGVRWLLPLCAWSLAVHALVRVAYAHLGDFDRRGKPVPAITGWAVAFMCALLVSGALHWPGAETFLRGIKGYFQMWGLLFGLAFFPWPEKTLQRLPLFFVAAALIQLPFAIQQYLVLVPARVGLEEGVVPVDIVSGTFGGELDAGGDNAVLSTFLMIVFAGLLSAWRHKVLSLTYTLVLGLPLIIPIALNVSKISILYAVVVFLVLFGQDIIRRPSRFLATGTLFAGVIAVLATAYTALAPEELSSWEDLAKFTYEGNVAQDYTYQGQLTRGGALKYWLENRSTQPLSATLLGLGPGATRAEGETDDTLVGGPVDPEVKVGRLAVTAVLWEGGVVALVCVFGLFASAFLAAIRLARAAQDSTQRAIFHALQATVAVLFISLWHKHFFVFHVGYQTVVTLIFGYLAFWVRNEGLLAQRGSAASRSNTVH